MGSTVRRQPITRNVPNAPDYKFLNLTSFGGLNMTDNPFTAPYNTASDCKNVYVDEFNALTTRPRLEKKYDIKTKLPDGSEIVDVHNLVNGYLIHYTVNNVYYMKMLLNSGELKTITGEIPTEKCTIFENGDVIYLLDGSSYKNIKDYVISDVEGYIPTTTAGVDIKNDLEGFAFEELNILSDKYKKTFYWDGSFDLGFTKDNKILSVENNYLENTRVLNSRVLSILDTSCPIKPLKDRLDFSEELEVWLGVKGVDLLEFTKDSTSFQLKKTINVFEDYGLTAPTYYTRLFIDCTDDGRFVVLKYYNTSNNADKQNGVGGLFVIDTKRLKGFRLFDPSVEYFYMSTDNCYDPTTRDKKLKISKDGSVIISSFKSTNSSNDFVKICVYDETTDSYITKNSSFSTIYETTISADGSTACVVTSDGIYYSKDIKADTISWTKFENKNVSSGFDADGSFILKNIALSNDGKTLALNRNYYYYDDDNNGYAANTIEPAILVCKDFENEIFTKILTKKIPRVLAFSEDDSKLFFACESKNDNSDQKEFLDGFVLLSVYEVMYENYNNHEKSGTFTYSSCIPIRLNVVKDVVYANFICYADDPYSYVYNRMFKNKYLFDSEEPLLEVTYKLDKTHKDFITHRNKFEEFVRSKLISRFENNWWFATNNKVYFTVNNNPTNIPINSYSSLGTDNDFITGFNVVQDDVLVVYKKNKLWVIQPTEINGIRTYTFSESKNTVGNTAFGSTIITTLTEMPLQINYDGIYVLRQLENVQSSDRLSVLISDTISKKWLKESKTTIDNAKTINRLYWTYVVLKDKDKTKIYLLDNRTNSWFYWELPINLLNIFVKDNETHLIDIKGNIYVLTTTDIPSEFVQGKLNYYDDGHKVIDWFWNSQILSLNTINYSKRLVDTTFILTDTDTQDNYSLDYKFKAYRKLVDETDYTTLQNDIKYVQSVTKKTLIPRFKFLQIELSNDKSDDWDDYNKVRLIGLGLKYVLLEVMR